MRRAGLAVRTALVAFVAGLAAGAVFALTATPSPAPPILALTGLLGMVAGEWATVEVRLRIGRKRGAT